MFFNPDGKFLHKFRAFSIDKIIFATLFLLFAALYSQAQEMPCLNLRSKGVKFVKPTDETTGCDNLRRQKAQTKQNRGEDNFTAAGIVRHENGVPLSGVTVTLTYLNVNKPPRTIVTGDDGAYFFDDLQIVEEIRLTPSKANYQFTPPSVSAFIVRNVVYNFVAAGPPPAPPVPPANQPTLAWTSYYTNPPPAGSNTQLNPDFDAMLARDSDGNVYVAGTSYRDYLKEPANTDISIFKTDAFGNRLWARTFNGPANYRDGAVDLATDAAGNVYVTGYAVVSTSGGEDYDYVILKYDADGNLLWTRYYSGNGGEDVPRSIKTDAAGNSYVTGYSWGNYANYATVKYDANGNRMWAKRYVGGFGELATEVEIDAGGNVYVTGYSGNSVAGDAEDFLTVKYSPTGDQLWVNRYNSQPGEKNDQAHEMEINAAGDVIVMGLSDDFIDAFTSVQKINGASGATVWTKSFNAWDGNEDDPEYTPYAMKVDAGGNIFLAGQIYRYFEDDMDAYITKINAEGVQQWTKIYDGPNNGDYDGDPKLALDAAGNAYLAVSSEGFANADLQIIKYLPDGAIGWTYRFDNPFHTDDEFIKWIDDNAQTNIFVDAAGGVTVAGDSFVPGQALNLTVFKLEPAAAQRAALFDFDGDRKADIAVFRPETGVWYVWRSSDGGYSIVRWGLAGDKLVPADYDGDGKNDPAVFRDGVWWTLSSRNGAPSSIQFGLAGDQPIPADYDNDGRADLGVFRQGVWHQLASSNNSYKAFQFGLSSDVPIPSDYDRNRRSDVAVYRGGNWYISLQAELPLSAFQFGVGTDKPVPADYDGDGQTDYAVFRGGTWYIHHSRTGAYATAQWGVGSDVPVPADYDGDKKTDLAVFREGIWYILYSSDNNYRVTQFGVATDIPIPAAR